MGQRKAKDIVTVTFPYYFVENSTTGITSIRRVDEELIAEIRCIQSSNKWAIYWWYNLPKELLSKADSVEYHNSRKEALGFIIELLIESSPVDL